MLLTQSTFNFMKLLFLWVALIGAAFVLVGFGSESTPLSEAESRQVRQRLQAYERGELTFHEVSSAAFQTNAVAITNLARFYQTHSNEVTVPMLLPISRCMAVIGRGREAATLAQRYLNVYSNDCRAWDILFAAKMIAKSYTEAIEVGTNALAHGCE